MSVDEEFMSVALEIARNGRGEVEPNPMVGALIVRDGVEIARGWHRRLGGPHAEVEAMTAARQAGADVRGATAYVSLEPCCHFGKTPPCTQALISAGVSRVVAAMQDVDPRVAGKGFEQLCRAGIDVTVGVLEAAARSLLAPYIKLRTRHRPWVICKWAQTADGYLAFPAGAGRRWVSCEQSRLMAHQLRSRCQGIVVGIETVLADDPLLTNRSRSGHQPARIVLDSRLRTPMDCQLVRSIDQSPVIVVTTADGADKRPDAVAALRSKGVEVLVLCHTSIVRPSTPKLDDNGTLGGGTNIHHFIDLDSLLDELGRRDWTYLLVEGGARVLESFVAAGLADELTAFVSGETIDPSMASGLPRFDLAGALASGSFHVEERQTVGADTMSTWRNDSSP